MAQYAPRKPFGSNVVFGWAPLGKGLQGLPVEGQKKGDVPCARVASNDPGKSTLIAGGRQRASHSGFAR